MQVKTTEIVNQALVTDLSIRTARAAYLYQIGDLVGAFNVTNEILDEAGMFQVSISLIRAGVFK